MRTLQRRLLVTTALTLGGSLAAAEPALAQAKAEPIKISVGGYVGQFVSYASQDDVGNRNAGRSGKLLELDQHSDQEIHFNGRTTLANGVTFGLRIELEGNTENDQIDESYMFIEGSFGRIELGQTNNAMYKMHMEAPESFSRKWITGDGNLTNVVTNPTASPSLDSTIFSTMVRFFDNDSDKINYYTPRFEGFQLGLSYIPDSSQDTASPTSVSSAYTEGYAVSVNFIRSFAEFDVAAAVGYMAWSGPQLTATTSAPDPYVVNAGFQLGYAGFRVGAGWAEIRDGRTGSAGTAGASSAGTGANKVEGRAWNVGASYNFGPGEASLTYVDGRNDSSPVAGPAFGDDRFTGLSLGGKYILGPGVNLEGVLFHVEFDGNGSTAPTSSNVATGGVVGLLLNF